MAQIWPNNMPKVSMKINSQLKLFTVLLFLNLNLDHFGPMGGMMAQQVIGGMGMNTGQGMDPMQMMGQGMNMMQGGQGMNPMQMMGQGMQGGYGSGYY